jgi:hypothetical protein
MTCAAQKITLSHHVSSGLARASPRSLVFYVWIYCVFWWILQDMAKVACYKAMRYYNLFGINDIQLHEIASEDGISAKSSKTVIRNPLHDEENTLHESLIQNKDL